MTSKVFKKTDSMQKWAKTWQISFNYDKCKVMHFGKKNKEHEFIMDLGPESQPHKIQKILVEMVSSDLKWATQVDKATKVAKAIIAQIKKLYLF